MELSQKERLILSNQYLILEKLYPEDAQFYYNKRKAIEYGFVLDYRSIAENINEDEISAEKCSEVYEILEMHRVLLSSFEKLSDKTGVEKRRIEFEGFDGNDESEQYSYLLYLVKDLGKYQELKEKELNSHCPTMGRYRIMLSRWKEVGKNYNLNKNDILKITAPA